MNPTIRVVVAGKKPVFRVEQIADGYQAVSETGEPIRLGPYCDPEQAAKASRDYLRKQTD